MKRLLIRVENSSHPPFRLQIRPGTRSCDVLVYLKLEEYVLSPASDPQKHFSLEEDLYHQISNDEKLIAQLSPDAVEATDKEEKGTYGS